MQDEISNNQPSVPQHVGLILDGNRRWAKAHNLPTFSGHQRGLDTFLEVVPTLYDQGVRYVSAYVFSTENWARAQDEVSYLMQLFYKVASEKLDELHKKNIRAVFLGQRERLDAKLLQAIDAIEAKTKANSRGTVALCLNYGGTYEIADALKAIITDGVPVDRVEPDLIAQHLYHPELPPIDLIIRTSGEQRLSNFMLWRAAYAELFFLDKHWPDVTEADLSAVLKQYAARNRRFGS